MDFCVEAGLADRLVDVPPSPSGAGLPEAVPGLRGSVTNFGVPDAEDRLGDCLPMSTFC